MRSRYLLCLSVVQVLGCASECVWNINKDIPQKDPVFYHKVGNAYRLLVPNSSRGIVLQKNQQLLIACPGPSNYVEKLGRETATLSCEDGTEVKADGLTRSVHDLQCVKHITSDIRKTDKTCGKNGTLLKAGYTVPEGWLQLYDICYDYGSLITLYSQHFVYGNSINGAFKGNERPAFRPSGLPSTVPFIRDYKKKTQDATFEKLLGGSAKTSAKGDFLSRGHLAPDADFIMPSWQRATYFFANVVPQWQSVNGGNWVKVESSVRTSAGTKDQVYKVYTGSSGVLQLKDVNNNNVSIYLDNKRLPVPKYVWKTVCDQQRNCVTFVSYNGWEKNETPCPSKCHETNWFRDGYDDVSKGSIYCCDTNDLRDILKNMPSVDAKGILNFE